MNAGQALASDTAPGKARVVFSNGGRILSVDANGGDRKVLFGKSRNPVNGSLGAVDPAVSPDGSRLAFAWRREVGADTVSDIWLADGDGTKPRRILKATRKTLYGDPTFSPAGSLVVAYFKLSGRKGEAGLVQIADDGSRGKKLLVDRQTRRRFEDWTTIRDPQFSPEGDRILYGTTVGGFPDAYESRLRVLNLRTGEDRLLVKKALDGDWSPDGRQIVYTALTWDDDFEVCADQEPVCGDGGRLKIIDANGGGQRRLVSTGGDQRSPDWSRDGRIVFQSAGNVPNAGEAYESFSVKPNGGCLTMLTNGSPASVAPAWMETGEVRTEPEACGSSPALSLELRRPTPKAALSDMFWAGPKAGSRLYTGISYDGRLPYLAYGDCGREKAATCGKPFWIAQAPVCAIQGDLASTAGAKAIRQQRGAPVFRFVGDEVGPVTYLLTGKFLIYIFGGSKGGVKEVAALRHLSEVRAEGDLPAPSFPAGDIRRMQKVKRLFKATGSLQRVSKRTGLGVRAVRANLRLSRSIKQYGEYETQNC